MYLTGCQHYANNECIVENMSCKYNELVPALFPPSQANIKIKIQILIKILMKY